MRMDGNDQVVACLDSMRGTFETAKENGEDAKVWITFEAHSEFSDLDSGGMAIMQDGDTLESLIARAADDCIEYSIGKQGVEIRNLHVDISAGTAGANSYNFHDGCALSELRALQNLQGPEEER